MSDPFAQYDKVRAERTPLTKEIDGEVFEFPGSCPANVALDFVNVMMASEVDPLSAAMMYLTKLLPEDKGEKLFTLLEVDELTALARGLFVHYGLLQESKEDDRPNRQTRRASQKKSSKGSARSGQTSGTTTS